MMELDWTWLVVGGPERLLARITVEKPRRGRPLRMWDACDAVADAIREHGRPLTPAEIIAATGLEAGTLHTLLYRGTYRERFKRVRLNGKRRAITLADAECDLNGI